jgi:hypothetical protein
VPHELRQPRLTLVHSREPRLTPLALWHLLSLDAPTVAALWTVFLARCAGLTLPWTACAAMFVAVWMLYATDRLLDARPTPDGRPPRDLEARHRFHHRHRAAFVTVLSLATFLLAWLLHRTAPAALHLYMLLAALLGGWLMLIHVRPMGHNAHRLPKELAVGIFFPAAVFVPTVARAPQLRPQLLLAAVLFGLVCTLNCLCIYAWEHPLPRNHAHWTTRWATRHLATLAVGTLLAAGLFAALRPQPTVALPALACALSTTALLALDTFRPRLSSVHLRAAADLTLLTPILLALLPRTR